MTIAPAKPAAAKAWRIAQGARRRGMSVSSAKAPAVSNPYKTYEAMGASSQEWAQVAPRLARTTTLCIPKHRRSPADVDRQQDDQDCHPQKLGNHTDIIDPCHQSARRPS